MTRRRRGASSSAPTRAGSDYYRCFTGNDWKNADNYDLCINSAVLGWDKCVALVKSYLDIKLS